MSHASNINNKLAWRCCNHYALTRILVILIVLIISCYKLTNAVLWCGLCVIMQARPPRYSNAAQPRRCRVESANAHRHVDYQARTLRNVNPEVGTLQHVHLH